MAELIESSGSRGTKILVEVENEFEDGIVVSFVDAQGTEYRGALLSQPPVDLSQTEAIVKAACDELANPLTFLHDHPYPNLRDYANHLSTNIPSDVLLQWNRLPSFTVPPISDNLKSIATRQKKNVLKKKEYASLNGTVNGPQLSMPQIRCATVFAEPEKEPPYLFPNYGLPGMVGKRRAKYIAQSRLKNDLDNFKRSDREFFKTSKQKATKRTGVVKSKKYKQDREFSSSPRPPAQKKYKLRGMKHEETISLCSTSGPPTEEQDEKTSLETNHLLSVEHQSCSGSKKLNIKKFSIELVKIPIPQGSSDHSYDRSSPTSSPIAVD